MEQQGENEQKLLKKLSFYLENGYNCAQSTAAVILELENQNTAANILLKAFYPNGFGFYEFSVCGAVSGTLAAMSYLLALEDRKEDEIVEISKEFKNQFTHECSSIYCSDLLNNFKDKNGINNTSNREFMEICTDCIKKAVIIVNDILEKENLMK